MFKDVIAKYQLAPNSYEMLEDNYLKAAELQLNLIEKWQDYVGEGWYGFDIPNAPISWYFALDDCLQIILDKCPQMKILQIKLKFGGLRMYVEADDCDIQDAIDELEKVCYDDSLVY